MEEKLRALVTRIDSSKLQGSDKDKLYKILAAGLQAIVLPILLKYLPKDQLKDLSDNPAKVTVDSYLKLLDAALVEGAAFSEIQAQTDRMFTEVDATLQKAGI